MKPFIRKHWPYGLILGAVLLIVVGIISSLQRPAEDPGDAPSAATTESAQPNFEPAPEPPSAESPLGSSLPGQAATAPDDENAVIIAEDNQDDATLVLVRRDHEYPWVRMEVQYEYDPISQSEEIVEYNTFAGDRVRVVPRPGVAPADVRQWAAATGAELRPLEAGNAFEVIWPEVKIDTLTQKMTETLSHTNLFNLIEPVDVEFDAFEVEVKEPR